MVRFQPEQMLEVLERHGVVYALIGGLAATLHGSPLRTGDVDICPQRNPENCDRLARALRELEARVRSPDGPLPFDFDARSLAAVDVLNLSTRFGDLDICARPAGFDGLEALTLVHYDLDGLVVPVASLENVIHSKESANREKDRAALPTLRKLLDKIGARASD